MSFLSKREQLIIISLVILVLAISLFNFIKKEVFSKDKDEGHHIEDVIDETDDEIETNQPEEIVVHISGQVNNPGIVKLEPGARVIDAVNAAGGLKNEADLDKINLAKKLQDEEKIYIPKIGEDIDENLLAPQNFAEGSKININTCTKEQLMSLPGIGEVLADRIIQYREKTPFKKVEDLMNVSGIGEKKFESIKDLIIVR